MLKENKYIYYIIAYINTLGINHKDHEFENVTGVGSLAIELRGANGF